jgi:hypothetical protein
LLAQLLLLLLLLLLPLVFCALLHVVEAHATLQHCMMQMPTQLNA